MRITKLTVQDYRGFHSEAVLDFGEPGRNVLIHGENGSGKSSIYHALNDFLEASFENDRLIVAQRNIFTQDSEPRILLEIGAKDALGNDTPGSGTYEWTADSSPYGKDVIQEAAKTKGFLDYRALLRTHFLQWDKQIIDVFPLLIETVLYDQPNPISLDPMGVEWETIHDIYEGRVGKHLRRDLQSRIKRFNDGLTLVLADLEVTLNNMVGVFGHGVELKLKPVLMMGYDARPKDFWDPQIGLHVLFNGHGLLRHHQFLNEARLSAIGIALYLAALKLNPPSDLRILALDDVLIGLDMANRLPVLEIIKQHFSDRQVFLLTHDKMWYEFVRLNTAGGDWCYFEMGSRPDHDGIERPWIRNVDDGIIEFLKRADKYLADNDQNASALSARMAFEARLKNYADKRRLLVPYQKDDRRLTSEDFWNVVIPDALAQNVARPTKHAELEQCKVDIEAVRKVILNPLSHGNAVSIARTEVELAIKAVRKLCTTL